MDLLNKVIKNKDVEIKPIWLMRQAGRYLPEFREIRSRNQNFIKLCLNKKLVPEITLQPLERFDFDAAIIFSDILMIPYGLNQKVEFKKNYGPILGEFHYSENFNIKKNDFKRKLKPVYESMSFLSDQLKGRNKSLIGFVGAPWTLLVYMLNQKSPKKVTSDDFLVDKSKVNKLLEMLIEYIKIHIEEQVKSGATIIQIFDSWAGLVKDKDLDKYIYEPTKKVVQFTQSLDIPVICFPREIKDYSKYVKIVSPDAISIDYNVNIRKIAEEIEIPIQGGLDPKILLSNPETLIKETKEILNVFKNKPYIFNLGHGVLPETNPKMVDKLVKVVRDNQ